MRVVFPIRNFLEVTPQLFFEFHQLIVFAGSDVQAELDRARDCVCTSGLEFKNSSTGEAGVSSGNIMRVYNKFGSCQQCIRTVRKVGRTSMATYLQRQPWLLRIRQGGCCELWVDVVLLNVYRAVQIHSKTQHGSAGVLTSLGHEPSGCCHGFWS